MENSIFHRTREELMNCGVAEDRILNLTPDISVEEIREHAAVYNAIMDGVDILKRECTQEKACNINGSYLAYLTDKLNGCKKVMEYIFREGIKLTGWERTCYYISANEQRKYIISEIEREKTATDGQNPPSKGITDERRAVIPQTKEQRPEQPKNYELLIKPEGHHMFCALADAGILKPCNNGLQIWKKAGENISNNDLLIVCKYAQDYLGLKTIKGNKKLRQWDALCTIMGIRSKNPVADMNKIGGKTLNSSKIQTVFKELKEERNRKNEKEESITTN